MKKMIAILFVLSLGLGLLTACQDEKPVDGQSDPTASVANTQETQAPGESGETEPGSESANVSESSTAQITDDEGNTITTTTGPSASGDPITTTAAAAATKAQAIKLYADTVDKTLKANRNISKHCKTVIDRPLQGDADAIKLVDMNILNIYHIETVVCEDLFGEGEDTYNQTAKEGLQPSYLGEGDVTDFSVKQLANGNTELILKVKNCSNPNKPKENQGSSPLGNFTWDYVNTQSINDGIKSAEDTVPGLKINIAKKNVDYTNIQIKATIKPDGSFASLVHSFNFKARAEDLEVKIAVIRVGGGQYIQSTAKSTITYTFK